ncbi:unnamed protein product [Cladocopium goreaui]|uniref:HTH La-type RNA-binding domain-containing protein n=1 Tax=Cladocopium goreaui TaxID=2562237 RepID=A0A9P1BVE4_9DINO|nr:unnamed protein product [Cladocopium goreaui]
MSSAVGAEIKHEAWHRLPTWLKNDPGGPVDLMDIRDQLLLETSKSGEQFWKLGTDAVVLSRPPWAATATEFQDKATIVRFLCSPGECGQLLIMAEAAGFLKAPSGLERSTLIASSKLQEQFLGRLRPWLSKEENVDEADQALYDQLEFLRLQPGSRACISAESKQEQTQLVLLPLNRAGAELHFVRSEACMPLANEQGAAILLAHPSEHLEVSGASQGVLHLLCLTLSRAQEPKHAPTNAFQIDGLSEKTKTRNLRGPSAGCPAPTFENPGSDFHMAPPALVPPPPAVAVDPPPMDVWPEDPVCQLEIGETVEAFWEPDKQYFAGRVANLHDDGAVSVAWRDWDGVAQLPNFLVRPRTMHWDSAD